MRFHMSAFLKAIFQPKDGTRERVKEAMAVSQEQTKRAVNRFETVIGELLVRNDHLTGRGRDEEDIH